MKRPLAPLAPLPPGPVSVADLRRRFEATRRQLGELDWLSEGSLWETAPGRWRWTRKVQNKTQIAALSPAQAEAFRKAIATHRHLEQLIRELRALTQAYILQTIPGPKRHPRKPLPSEP